MSVVDCPLLVGVLLEALEITFLRNVDSTHEFRRVFACLRQLALFERSLRKNARVLRRKLEKSVERVCPRVSVENPPQHDDGVGLERAARQIPKRGVAVERTVNVLIFARDVMYGLLGVEALNRLFYLIAEHF